jgi:hypothetical protein
MINKYLNESIEIAHKQGYTLKLKELRQKIVNKEYNENEILWSGGDLIISANFVDSNDKVVVTPYPKQYSWLVMQLQDIYKYDYESKYILFPMIGAIMNSLQKQHQNNLEKFMQEVVILSTLYLHPEHLGELVFFSDTEE